MIQKGTQKMSKLTFVQVKSFHVLANKGHKKKTTVDGSEILHQLRLVVSPIVYELFTSQVVQDFLHQPYRSLPWHLSFSDESMVSLQLVQYSGLLKKTPSENLTGLPMKNTLRKKQCTYALYYKVCP